MNLNLKIIVTVLSAVLLVSCQTQREVTEEGPELSNNKIVLDSAIWSIYQDTKGTFWFGSNGSGVYRKVKDSLEHFDRENGLAGNQIRGIQEDNQGNIYFDTPDGVSKFDGSSFETLKMVRSNDWKLNENDLWFKGNGDPNGVYRYDGSVLHYLIFPEQDLEGAYGIPFPERSFSPYGVYSTYRDEMGDMWFGTLSAGVFHYDGDTIHWIAEKELTTLEDGRVPGIRSIIEDKNGDFWFSHSRYKYSVKRDEGFSYGKKDSSHGPDRMDFSYYMSAVKDEQGNVWLITYSDGVYQFDGENLRHYPVYDGDRKVLLYSAYVDRSGQLWLATHNAGLMKLQGESFIKIEF